MLHRRGVDADYSAASYRGGASAVVVAGEEPILSTDGRGAERPLAQIVGRAVWRKSSPANPSF